MGVQDSRKYGGHIYIWNENIFQNPPLRAEVILPGSYIKFAIWNIHILNRMLAQPIFSLQAVKLCVKSNFNIFQGLRHLFRFSMSLMIEKLRCSAARIIAIVWHRARSLVILAVSWEVRFSKVFSDSLPELQAGVSFDPGAQSRTCIVDRRLLKFSFCDRDPQDGQM